MSSSINRLFVTCFDPNSTSKFSSEINCCIALTAAFVLTFVLFVNRIAVSSRSDLVTKAMFMTSKPKQSVNNVTVNCELSWMNRVNSVDKRCNRVERDTRQKVPCFDCLLTQTCQRAGLPTGRAGPRFLWMPTGRNGPVIKNRIRSV